jgi:putative ABC transport system permease protein
MAPAMAGVIVGLGASVVTVRYMQRLVPFAYHIGPWTYAVAVPLLIAIALVAAFFPARRAARVNPTEALRCE